MTYSNFTGPSLRQKPSHQHQEKSYPHFGAKKFGPQGFNGGVFESSRRLRPRRPARRHVRREGGPEDSGVAALQIGQLVALPRRPGQVRRLQEVNPEDSF